MGKGGAHDHRYDWVCHSQLLTLNLGHNEAKGKIDTLGGHSLQNKNPGGTTWRQQPLVLTKLIPFRQENGQANYYQREHDSTENVPYLMAHNHMSIYEMLQI